MVAQVLLWTGIPEACHIKGFQASLNPSPGLLPALVCQSFANRCWLLFAGLTCKGIAASLKMGGNG